MTPTPGRVDANAALAELLGHIKHLDGDPHVRGWHGAWMLAAAVALSQTLSDLETAVANAVHNPWTYRKCGEMILANEGLHKRLEAAEAWLRTLTTDDDLSEEEPSRLLPWDEYVKKVRAITKEAP